MKKRIRPLLCFFGIHSWQVSQHLFATREAGEIKTETVIAWRNCKHCWKTKLIHILK